jgi:hypothetical protein
LIKRTTPKKLQGRRIVACELPKGFLENYPVYFCENHVNLVLTNNGAESYLAGLNAWFNSQLANFLFGMMNGSSHLSKYEIGLLPASEDLLASLGKIKSNGKKELMCKIDDTIFDFYKINGLQIARISQLISSS